MVSYFNNLKIFSLNISDFIEIMKMNMKNLLFI
jgi:hypothetical protein